MIKMRVLVHTYFVVVITLWGCLAFGQEYPNRPIRIVAPAAGGNGDFLSRSIAEGISGNLGQRILVDNRASAVIQGEAVYRAPPDGYSLLLAGGAFWINPLLRASSYDPIKDFAAITMTERAPLLLVVHPSLPVKSVKDLVALAKAKPGQLNYSTTGVGSSFHLASEIFKALAGVDIVHVAYKGTAPSILALIAGEVQLQFGPPSSLIGQVNAGKLRALAVTSTQRSALFPDLPTVGASGLPGYEAVGITGVFAPAKVPVPIINRLNSEIVQYLGRAEVRKLFLERDSEVVGSSPAQLAAAVEDEMNRSAKVIKALGLRLE